MESIKSMCPPPKPKLAAERGSEVSLVPIRSSFDALFCNRFSPGSPSRYNGLLGPVRRSGRGVLEQPWVPCYYGEEWLLRSEPAESKSTVTLSL